MNNNNFHWWYLFPVIAIIPFIWLFHFIFYKIKFNSIFKKKANIEFDFKNKTLEIKSINKKREILTNKINLKISKIKILISNDKKEIDNYLLLKENKNYYWNSSKENELLKIKESISEKTTLLSKYENLNDKEVSVYFKYVINFNEISLIKIKKYKFKNVFIKISNFKKIKKWKFSKYNRGDGKIVIYWKRHGLFSKRFKNLDIIERGSKFKLNINKLWEMLIKHSEDFNWIYFKNKKENYELSILENEEKNIEKLTLMDNLQKFTFNWTFARKKNLHRMESFWGYFICNKIYSLSEYELQSKGINSETLFPLVIINYKNVESVEKENYIFIGNYLNNGNELNRMIHYLNASFLNNLNVKYSNYLENSKIASFLDGNNELKINNIENWDKFLEYRNLFYFEFEKSKEISFNDFLIIFKKLVKNNENFDFKKNKIEDINFLHFFTIEEAEKILNILRNEKITGFDIWDMRYQKPKIRILILNLIKNKGDDFLKINSSLVLTLLYGELYYEIHLYYIKEFYSNIFKKYKIKIPIEATRWFETKKFYESYFKNKEIKKTGFQILEDIQKEYNRNIFEDLEILHSGMPLIYDYNESEKEITFYYFIIHKQSFIKDVITISDD